MKTVYQTPKADAGTARPFGYRQSLSVDCQKAVVAPVPSLRFHRGPLAIVGRVGAVVVDTVHRVLRARPASHVGKEVSEPLAFWQKPSFANSYSAAAVVFVIAVAVMMASPLHVVPSSVFNTSRFTVELVRSARIATFTIEAPTALLLPDQKVSRTDNANLTALAAAEPRMPAVIVVADIPSNMQPLEDATRQVLKAGFAGNRNRSSHDALLLIKGPSGQSLADVYSVRAARSFCIDAVTGSNMKGAL